MHVHISTYMHVYIYNIYIYTCIYIDTDTCIQYGGRKERAANKKQNNPRVRDPGCADLWLQTLLGGSWDGLGSKVQGFGLSEFGFGFQGAGFGV